MKVLFICMILSSCVPRTAVDTAVVVKEASDYKAELTACRKETSTCEGYVACRKRVALSHGETYTGRCER
jgi:hypothetical protein